MMPWELAEIKSFFFFSVNVDFISNNEVFFYGFQF